jgi:galactokinase
MLRRSRFEFTPGSFQIVADLPRVSIDLDRSDACKNGDSGQAVHLLDIVSVVQLMLYLSDPVELLQNRFGGGVGTITVSVPGRVNLIGEHIDYHNLPVFPMAIQRRILIAIRPRPGRQIRVTSSGGYGDRTFEWLPRLAPSAAGDWINYVKAAAQAVGDRWGVLDGIDAAVVSDLPPAAGLSSSSALLTGFTLALLRANGIRTTFDELMQVLPEAEYFVGTRGGGMDHAAVLASKSGCALLVEFAPVTVTDVAIPAGWSFLVAHSLTTAEKSGAVRAEYNARRAAGARALEILGLPSFRAAVEQHSMADMEAMARDRLGDAERGPFLHVTGEAASVRQAVNAMREADAERFGTLLFTSHASARDLLRISCPALDELVERARAAGALGARLTGAGFGGCAVVFCREKDRDSIRAQLVETYYEKRAGFDPAIHLINAEPSAGALSE